MKRDLFAGRSGVALVEDAHLHNHLRVWRQVAQPDDDFVGLTFDARTRVVRRLVDDLVLLANVLSPRHARVRELNLQQYMHSCRLTDEPENDVYHDMSTVSDRFFDEYRIMNSRNLSPICYGSSVHIPHKLSTYMYVKRGSDLSVCTSRFVRTLYPRKKP